MSDYLKDLSPERRAVFWAQNLPIILIDPNYEVTAHGVMVYDSYPINKINNLSAFPVEKKISEHRISSLAYQHLFRHLHAVKLVTKTNMKVLDIGAGECLNGHFLFQRMKKSIYVAVDLMYNRLVEGINRGFGYEKYIFIQRDLTRNLPFSNNQFDIIYAYEAIEYLEKEQAEKLLAECYRVLKPEGIISISTPNNRGKKIADKYKKYKAHGTVGVYEEHPFEASYSELMGWLKNIGFKVTEEYGLDYDHISEANFCLGESTAKAVRNYFPSGVARLLLSLQDPQNASFMMIEATKC